MVCTNNVALETSYIYNIKICALFIYHLEFSLLCVSGVFKNFWHSSEASTGGIESIFRAEIFLVVSVLGYS
jgi:hypothetical protein